VTSSLTYWIELAVGTASVAIAVPAWRAGGASRVVGVVLAVAGVAATAHAASELVT
jgi:hypothetical protein